MLSVLNTIAQIAFILPFLFLAFVTLRDMSDAVLDWNDRRRDRRRRQRSH